MIKGAFTLRRERGPRNASSLCGVLLPLPHLLLLLLLLLLDHGSSRQGLDRGSHDEAVEEHVGGDEENGHGDHEVDVFPGGLLVSGAVDVG